MDSSPYSTYYEFLSALHVALHPRTYVEIGVYDGASLGLAEPSTLCIGIDPEPKMDDSTPEQKLFPVTSDRFFEEHDLSSELGGLPLDLAFIDGMHLFENALRDFVNLERYSHPGSVFLLHDCIPIDEATSTRERDTDQWTGDIWKLLFCLLEHRPELRISVIDVYPSGLAVVEGLDRENTVLKDLYGALVEQYVPLDYSFYATRSETARELVRDPGEVLARLASR